MKLKPTTKFMLCNIFSVAAFVFAITATSIAHADLEGDAAALKACISQSIKLEEEKSEPSLDSTLRRCQSDYKKLIKALPEGSESAVYHDIKHGIENKLKNK